MELSSDTTECEGGELKERSPPRRVRGRHRGKQRGHVTNKRQLGTTFVPRYVYLLGVRGVVGGLWWLVVGGGGGCWLVGGGWWLVVVGGGGGWWWWLVVVVGGWWLLRVVVVGWLMVGGGWWW